MAVDSFFDPLDLTGRQGQKKAQKLNEQNVASAIAALEKSFGEGLSTQQDALGIFRQGFQSVLNDVNTLGNESRQGARDSATQASGGYRQSDLGRSLSSSTVAAGHQRGVERDLVNDLAGINEGLAGLRSNVRFRGLGMEQGLLGNIAQTQIGRGTAESAFRSGVQYNAPPGILGDLLGAAGSAIGASG